jgi:FkbM family methyltransferase
VHDPHSLPTLALRPGTNDDVIYNSVVRRNEYRLPEHLPAGAIVVDIGVHIGAFSYLALARGAAAVYGFEPEASNLARARENLAAFGDRVHLSSRAVWRSDEPPAPQHFWASTDRANTGGGTLIWDTEGPLVDAVPFDDVVDTITESGRRRIDLVKIDCEGAEFPILLSSARLSRIDRIVGEYHELRAELPAHVRVGGCREFTVGVLTAALERAGFVVSTQQQATAQYGALGLFFADRHAVP